MRQAPVTSKAARDYLRVFLAGASDEMPDKQGRVTIPPALREYAGLTRDCVVIGASTRVEVWDARLGRPTSPSSEQALRRPVRGGAPGSPLTPHRPTDHDATHGPPYGEVSTRSASLAHLPRCQAAALPSGWGPDDRDQHRTAAASTAQQHDHAHSRATDGAPTR